MTSCSALQQKLSIIKHEYTLGEVQPLSLPVSLTPMYLGAYDTRFRFNGICVLNCRVGGRGDLELPGEAGHDVDGVGASDTHGTHAQACNGHRG
jgi:hypothetical protein